MRSIWTAFAMVLLLISLGGQLAALPPGQRSWRRSFLIGLGCVSAGVLVVSLYLVATALAARGR